MGRALELARRAADCGEVPVGAIVVRDGVIVGAGHNRTILDNDPSAHAEIVALRAAGANLGTARLVDCDLYVTLEPCAMCAGAIANARIRRLYFGALDPKGGAVESGPCLFTTAALNHAPEVYGGFREREAAALLEDFFRARR